VSAAATLAAFPVAALAIWGLLRSPAARRGLVATPSEERWHTTATPTFGGVGLILGIGAGMGAAFATGVVDPGAELLAVLGGCALLFLAGLADDVFHLRPATKLAAQFAAAGIALAGGLRAEIFSNDVLALGLAFLWLVGLTNAFNLLDNMDGLAASMAAIACAYFAVAAVMPLENNEATLALSLAVCFACAGFLPFNLRLRRPAAVFMGDSGSQVLGFALAALGLLGSWKEAGTTVATLVLPLLVLAVPILDTALVTLVRLLEGRPVSQGGKDHTSHRLVYRGLSEKRAVILLAVIAAALGATSLGYNVLANPYVTLVGVLLTFAALLQFGTFLGESDSERAATHGLLVHRRLLVEVAVDAALIVASLYAAYLVVVEGSGTTTQRYAVGLALGVILFARYLAFIALRIYRAVWRYAGARDVVAIVVAVLASEAAAYGFLELFGDMRDLPRSIFAIDALIAGPLIGASRFGERALVAALGSLRRSERRRTLIVGAGSSGRSMMRELREQPGEQIVGFLDDDPGLRGRRLQGVPVLGTIDEIDDVLERARPESVLVTIAGASRERLDLVSAACARAGVPCRFVRLELSHDPYVLIEPAAE
jgi:UDP-GlcNAc:undecaprenyl-phosphate GlcNAc-1-phosphate transferase